jgi:hypothetical protein
LHFCEFSTIFYAFYKFQQFTTTIEDSLCTGTPRNIQNVTAMPCHALKSLQRKGITQLGPRPWGRRGSADSGETGGTPGRARAWGGVHAHQGAIDTRNLGAEALYDGARR